MNGHFAVRFTDTLVTAPGGMESGDNSRKAGIPTGIKSFAARQCDSTCRN